MLSIDEIRGVDDVSRRPGHEGYRPVAPWPNARIPPAPQAGRPTVPRRVRAGKPMTPVFGTSCPLRGLSGIVRRWAYGFPEHRARHWLLLLFADRVEATAPRLRRLAPYAASILLAALATLRPRARKALARSPSTLLESLRRLGPRVAEAGAAR